MSSIDLAKWPFGKFVVASICMNAIHFFLQMRWAAIRYTSFGPRPKGAQAYIGFEVILLMLILGIGFEHIGDENRTRSVIPYYLGIVAAIGAWVVVSFLL